MRLQFLSALVMLTAMLSAQNFYQIPVPAQAKLNCISFGTNQIGFIGGNDSTLLKTTDGGKTWTRLAIHVNENVSYHNITAIEFLDAQTGYMLDANAIFKTTDGGLTWVGEQPNQTNMCFKNALFFHDVSNGFVGGALCFQGATIGNKVNGNWDTINVVGGWDASEGINAFDFWNAQLGLAVGPRQTLYRTTNGGQTWDSIPNILDSIPLSDVVFVNSFWAYATYEQAGLEGAIVSTDGGLTWQRDWDLATFAYPGLSSTYRTGAGQAYLGGWVSWGNGGIIFRHWPNWWIYDLVPQRINGLGGYADSIVFAVGDSGYVGVNVLPQNIGLPENHQSAFSIYPNPATDAVNIKLQSEDNIGQSFLILDVTGSVVINGVLNSVITRFNVGELPSGVYVVQVGHSSAILNRLVKR